jgi:hypothetical protein
MSSICVTGSIFQRVCITFKMLCAASRKELEFAGAQVIDAEMARRALLEVSPIPSVNEDPVNFDTAEIPWWAWVRRFHLPEVRPPHFFSPTLLALLSSLDRGRGSRMSLSRSTIFGGVPSGE